MAMRLSEGDILVNLDADNFKGNGFAVYLNTGMQKYDFLAGEL